MDNSPTSAQLLCVQEYRPREWKQFDGVQHLPESLPSGASSEHRQSAMIIWLLRNSVQHLFVFKILSMSCCVIPGVPQPPSEQWRGEGSSSDLELHEVHQVRNGSETWCMAAMIDTCFLQFVWNAQKNNGMLILRGALQINFRWKLGFLQIGKFRTPLVEEWKAREGWIFVMDGICCVFLIMIDGSGQLVILWCAQYCNDVTYISMASWRKLIWH